MVIQTKNRTTENDATEFEYKYKYLIDRHWRIFLLASKQDV